MTPIDVLMPAESSYYYQHFTAVRNALGNEANPHDIRQPQLHFRWAYELATHPLVVAAVEDLIGSDILLCRGTFFWKDAHSRAFYPYHQDAYGLGFDAHAARLFVTAWIALTDSTAQSGCMKVIPGSHKTELPHSEPFIDGRYDNRNAVSRGLTVAGDFSAHERCIELHSGQMSLHHANLIHGSGPNDSNGDRVGIVFRYMAPEVRQSTPLKHPVVLVQGVDRVGRYRHLSQPPTDDLKAGLQSNAAYIRDHEEGELYRRQSESIRWSPGPITPPDGSGDSPC